MKDNRGKITATITILIADDHRLIRESWKTVLENDPCFRVTGLAADGNEVISMAAETKPDIILMDINMRPVNGLDATVAILANRPATKIIAVSMTTAPGYIKKIMRLGFAGYINKNSSTHEFFEAILSVYDGKKYLCSETKDMLASSFIRRHPEGNRFLTRRELTVVDMIRQGLSSNEMANRLGISGRTIEVHRYNILKKLNVHNAVGVINAASEMGI